MVSAIKRWRPGCWTTDGCGTAAAVPRGEGVRRLFPSIFRAGQSFALTPLRDGVGFAHLGVYRRCPAAVPITSSLHDASSAERISAKLRRNAGAVYATCGAPDSSSSHKISHSRYALIDTDSNDALVLIPAANAEYAEVANQLYLQPNGFDGTATIFLTPEPGNEVASVAPGVQALVQTIENDYTANDLSASDPLYVFGYSQGAVEESLAQQQLHDFGIPTDGLHFVMVGDSASAEGGFLNSFIDSLPESWQQPTTELFAQLGVTPPVLGATTPDNLYPTDVYSLTSDGWVNWDNGANIPGMFADHLGYLGLTPEEIAGATVTTDGLTEYFTINSANVDILSALWEQLLLALNFN